MMVIHVLFILYSIFIFTDAEYYKTLRLTKSAIAANPKGKCNRSSKVSNIARKNFDVLPVNLTIAFLVEVSKKGQCKSLEGINKISFPGPLIETR